MRFAHVDEAGTSKSERICVVAGVVSHADAQWLTLNEHLTGLADEMVPPEDREGIVFHAKDIWHGTKKFHRNKWPREKRVDLLCRLADMPYDFALPVILGAVPKGTQNWGKYKSQGDLEARHYSVAFGLCVVTFEYVLRMFCQNELGTIIAEDNPEMRRYAKLGYGILKDRSHKWPEESGVANYMPLERVVEQPLFTEKRDSGILQIADLVAFVVSRRMNGHDDVKDLFDRVTRQLVMLPHKLSP